MWQAQASSPATAPLPSMPRTSGMPSRVRWRDEASGEPSSVRSRLSSAATGPIRGSARQFMKERMYPMAISPLAGKPAPKEMLVDLARLEREYYERRPDLSDRNQLVSFGTSGHR